VEREPRYDVPKKAPGPLRLVQEFLNTRDKEHGRDGLDSPAALRGWLEDRGLPSPSRPTQRDIVQARDAREALRELVRANSGQSAPLDAIELLDELADAAALTVRFDPAGGVELHVAAGGLAGGLGHVLALAVEAAIDGRWSRLKACRNCSWSFYDYSPNRSAKWCSMQLCGNRRKTRAYYRRRRARGAAKPDTT
jgi:predicted RNA-binding Zn ribbon-like protein